MSIKQFIKVLVWSLVVGLILSIWFDGPLDLYHWLVNHVDETLDSMAAFAQWSLSPLILGACVVVPIALIVWLVNRKR